MATIYKHGAEIARFSYLTYDVLVMSDGKLLRNQGDGWKLWRKCKADSTPAQVAQVRQAKVEGVKQTHPCFSEYKRMLHAEVCLRNRAIVHEIISSMPQDADGCYSELSDHGFWHGSLDDMVELCRAFQAMEIERDQVKATTETAAA